MLRRNRKLGAFCALVWTLFFGTQAHALVYVDVMGTASGSQVKPKNGKESSESNLGVYASLFFGADLLSFGPVLTYDKPNNADYDYTVGAGARLDTYFFLGAGGGYLKRHVQNENQDGYMAYLEVGRYVMLLPTLYLKAAMMGTYKSVLTKDREVEIYQYAPYLGLQLSF